MNVDSSANEQSRGFVITKITERCLPIHPQIVSMLGNANQTENCLEWGDWGPCIWVKGLNPLWQRSYFDQLLPGRKGCRNHMFFKLLRERWGEALNNVLDYFKELIIDEEPCGFCSYQHSCGRKCNRRADFKSSINALFVAERRCMEFDQINSCKYKFNQERGCKLWPNNLINLPNVSDSMKDFINGMSMLNCVEAVTESEATCRCCCAPYTPNPLNKFKCEYLQK
uniref:Uncharacterized protein n=1 Tax=Meloidogyne incognita TaxID=6306 RepID=A0A914M0H2_MELIC